MPVNERPELADKVRAAAAATRLFTTGYTGTPSSIPACSRRRRLLANPSPSTIGAEAAEVWRVLGKSRAVTPCTHLTAIV